MVGEAERADLAAPDQVVERPQRLLERGVRIDVRGVVQVQVVRAESPQARLDRRDDVVAREAVIARAAGAVLARVVPLLGRQDYLVPPPFKRDPQALLGGAVRW